MNQRNYQFRLKEASATGATSIRLLFYHQGQRWLYGTGCQIIPSLWNPDSQEPTKSRKLISEYSKSIPQLDTQLKNIRARLKKIVTLSDEWFGLADMSMTTPKKKDWKEYLDSKIKTARPEQKKEKRKDFKLSEIFTDFIFRAGRGKILTDSGSRYNYSTVKAYMTTKEALDKFQDHSSRQLMIEDVSREMIEDWLQYLYSERNVKPAYAGRCIQHLKRVVREFLSGIQDQNYKLIKKDEEPLIKDIEVRRILSSLDKIKKPKSQSTHVALTRTEVRVLFELDDMPAHLSKARDIFLCGCYTALRHSDYSRIRPHHIKGEYIEMINQKTKYKVKIPIRPELRTILERHDYSIPELSPQKLNKYIKEVCQLAGIDGMVQVNETSKGQTVIKSKPKYELMTTHTARRTGATNMYLAGIPAYDIMKLTAHKKLDSFQKYILIDQLDSIKRIEQSDFFKGAGHLKIA